MKNAMVWHYGFKTDFQTLTYLQGDCPAQACPFSYMCVFAKTTLFHTGYIISLSKQMLYHFVSENISKIQLPLKNINKNIWLRLVTDTGFSLTQWWKTECKLGRSSQKPWKRAQHSLLNRLHLQNWSINTCSRFLLFKQSFISSFLLCESASKETFVITNAKLGI